MKARIAVLPGDGIGPEVMPQAIQVLEAIAKQFGHSFEFRHADVGGAAIDKTGRPLPDDTLKLAKESDAILLGAVGGYKWEGLAYDVRPERALLGLREQLGLFANLRPAKLYPMLADASTLKPEVIIGTDLLVVRELTGGIYFGKPKGIEKTADGERGVNTEVYTTPEIVRIAKVAFEAARKRRKKVMSVDKANVLESSELWRRVVIGVAKDYPDVELSHLHVELLRIADELHRAVVHVEMAQLDVRIVLRHADDDPPPELRGLEHVGLVHGHDLLAALARGFEGDFGDADDLRRGIDLGVDAALAALVGLDPARRAEVDPAGQLADHHDVETVDDLGLERRGVGQHREEHGGAEVGERAEALPQAQQGPLGPLRVLQALPLGTADGAEQHGVGVERRLQRLVGQRNAEPVDRRPAHEGLAELKAAPPSLADRFQHPDRFGHDLAPHAVARQQGDAIGRHVDASFPARRTPSRPPEPPRACMK